MIRYSIINTPLGETVLGRKDGKICFCHFAVPSLEAVLQRVAADFPGEEILPVPEQNEPKTSHEVDKGVEEPVVVQEEIALEQLLQGRCRCLKWEDLHLEGTPLQLSVWREIFNLLPDELISYSALATRCSYPKAVRAVATAVGKNPISLIIPCHRVLRQEAFPKDCAGAGRIRIRGELREHSLSRDALDKLDTCKIDEDKLDSCRIDRDKLGNYYWGKELKRRILEWEGLI